MICLINCKVAKYFSSMDLLSSYHQVPHHPSDMLKTTFHTCMGIFQFKVYSMGLTNALSTFVHVMNVVFTGLLETSVLVYLDDILVFSKTEEERWSLQHVKQVHGILRNHQFHAKLSRCKFGKNEFELSWACGQGSTSKGNLKCLEATPEIFIEYTVVTLLLQEAAHTLQSSLIDLKTLQSISSPWGLHLKADSLEAAFESL